MKLGLFCMIFGLKRQMRNGDPSSLKLRRDKLAVIIPYLSKTTRFNSYNPASGEGEGETATLSRLVVGL